MHSYIPGVCLVMETVLKQIRMSLAHNHQEKIDTYMKNREQIQSIYVIVMKDDDEMVFKKQILHEKILY